MRKLGTYPVRWAGLTLAQRVEAIARAGFDSVSASGIAQLTAAQPQENLPRLAAAYGLHIDTVHLTGRETNAVWLEGPQGAAVIARYLAEMEQAVRAGVTRAVAHVTWGLSAPPLTALGVERFGTLVRRAEQLGLTLCFENSVSVPHLRAVLDSDDAACFCLDTGHWHAFAPGSDIALRYAPRIRAVHLQDNDGAHDLHLIPLDGCVPFDALAAALRGVPVLTMEAAGRVDKPLPGEDGAELSRRLAGLPGAKAGLLRAQGDRVLAYERMDFSAYLNRLHEAGTALAQRIGGDADV